MPEGMIVTYCAPTLAGLKTASLFTCSYRTRKELYADIAAINRSLNDKGLHMMVIGWTKRRALIYVYRPRLLKKDLQDEGIRQILKEKGYDPDHMGMCLTSLISHLKKDPTFPHEIGCFLGYPSEDIIGFMDSERRCIHADIWQVYGDAENARRRFDMMHRCTRSYQEHFRRGMSLESLAVSEQKG